MARLAFEEEVIWPWQPRIQPGDRLLSCPECASRHARSLSIIRTAVIRAGRYVSVPTGDVVECVRCGHKFVATDEGTFRLHANSPPQAVEPSNGPPPKYRAPEPPLRVPPRV
jgi:hypothetical protein